MAVRSRDLPRGRHAGGLVSVTKRHPALRWAARAALGREGAPRAPPARAKRRWSSRLRCGPGSSRPSGIPLRPWVKVRSVVAPRSSGTGQRPAGCQAQARADPAPAGAYHLRPCAGEAIRAARPAGPSCSAPLPGLFPARAASAPSQTDAHVRLSHPPPVSRPARRLRGQPHLFPAGLHRARGSAHRHHGRRCHGGGAGRHARRLWARPPAPRPVPDVGLACHARRSRPIPRHRTACGGRGLEGGSELPSPRDHCLADRVSHRPPARLHRRLLPR